MFTALQIGVVTFVLTVVATAGFFFVGALIGVGSVLLQGLRALRRPSPMPAVQAAPQPQRRAAAQRASAAAPRREPVVPA